MAKAAEPLPTVTGLVLEKYMGRWYEIANIPSRFQPSDTTNTRATYELLPNGIVSVVNETFKANGKIAGISGKVCKAQDVKAWKNDKDSPDAEFTVQFWVPPFLPVIPVNGDYWVLDLAEDYSYALVGQPKREYLWVLCRNTSLEEETYTRLMEKATDLGYDVSRVKKTVHKPDVSQDNSSQGGKDGWWWLKGMF